MLYKHDLEYFFPAGLGRRVGQLPGSRMSKGLLHSACYCKNQHFLYMIATGDNLYIQIVT